MMINYFNDVYIVFIYTCTFNSEFNGYEMSVKHCNVMTKQTHPYVSPVPSTFDFIFLTSTHLPALLNMLRSPSCEANDKHVYL